MHFKKTKIKNVRDAYDAVRFRNALSAGLLGTFAVLVVLLVGAAVLARASDISINLPFSSFSAFGGLGGGASEDDVPEKVNILLTGVGGEAHDGPELTDTVILASVNRKTKTVSMLSIPRDLYVEYPTGGRGKFNEVYSRALSKNPGNAVASMGMLAEKVREITGERVDRYVNVDFAGFSDFVNVLGGVQVDVPEDLTDTAYPDGNWGYTTFKVKKGIQTFDGETALKYARSRHSTSDFDRSLRQQMLVRAIKEKLFSLGTLSNPLKIKALYGSVSSHLKTDLSFEEMAALALFARDLPSENILSFNLNDSCFQSISTCDRGGLLYTPARDLFGGASVLLPDGATAENVDEYRDIQRFANLAFNYPRMFLENFEINVVNSTKQSGVAVRTALFLKKFGFNVPEKDSVGQTKDPYERTTVLIPWDTESKTGFDPESATAQALSMFTFSDPVPVPASKYAKTPGPKVEVVLGPDHALFFR